MHPSFIFLSIVIILGTHCTIFLYNGVLPMASWSYNISQKMRKVTTALIHKNMINKYIQFPDTPNARQTISQRYLCFHNYTILIRVSWVCMELQKVLICKFKLVYFWT